MTLQMAYQNAYASLGPDLSEDTAFDLSCLFEHIFGVPRRAPSNGAREADSAKLAAFHGLVARYKAGEPLQYLLGMWEFYGLPFEVGPGVLIPRPDTETLVETALRLLKGAAAPAVADLCAGSGCVAAAIAHARPDAHVYAVELSDAAFIYLVRNLARNAPGNTKAIRGDVFAPPPLPPLDLIVSNPPYITRAEMETLSPQVRREPEMALLGGEDGLDFYRALPRACLPLLRPGGYIAFEVGYTQADAVADLLRQNGYQSCAAARDLAGIRRVVYARRPED
ncbi:MULTISPECIES: peptide chain release factor N(5)-glutamine methyltransferase [Anaerotruncus]|jgi:release factor glutamine methyltransferase|uniref:Release factor glutamine methyltransferase n=1 Tax=Anaerotruncus colihominis TaxID=169435 RepID=A0A845SRM5_9FIRM|nr:MULTISPECIES: peptide chain release factor N(5)-glutamine methyltransferase [Anaerotruncus]MCI8493029.1 peptide chain release factor N(5)-glutamine methyltransferase [Anaerotruncus sp.]MCR2025591.1 peptide chain release factor N(5)-glutamine methyltransferase [Anaerotruncus colihominis]NDO39699.1 peptide chain release factor N(5)-glutamine methyltransferase [Anaerotruncus colihominis]